MSQFANTIPDAIRRQLTVLPPPMWDKRTGEFIPYDGSDDARLSDVALSKRDNVVYVDEELSVFDHPGSSRHYRMMIRRMPWRADLELILMAARHMLLVGDYTMDYNQREGLSPEMESGYWDIQYTVPIEQIKTDGDTLSNVGVLIPYRLRKRIWTELFAAMGHKVKWGSSVLNVRKRR